eukprot:scaffold98484_cov32-Tisochrysis_lutea.AAC.1
MRSLLWGERKLGEETFSCTYSFSHHWSDMFTKNIMCRGQNTQRTPATQYSPASLNNVRPQRPRRQDHSSVRCAMCAGVNLPAKVTAAVQRKRTPVPSSHPGSPARALAVEIFLRGLPIAAAVGLKEGGDHVAESVRVSFEETLLHLLVGNEDLVGILVHEVVDGACGRRPAHSIAQPLGDLARPLVARLKHALIELRVEELGAGVKADRLREGAHLGVRGGSVGDEGGRLLTVSAER